MNWAYIAGFFDGEGNVWLGNGKRDEGAYCVSIANTHQPTIIAISKFLMQEGIRHSVYDMIGKARYEQYKKKGWKMAWFIKVLAHESTRNFLQNMLPFLITKREAALKLIEFIDSKKWRVPIPDELLEQAKALYESGMSPRKIHKQLSISPRSFFKYAKIKGWRLRDHGQCVSLSIRMRQPKLHQCA